MPNTNNFSKFKTVLTVVIILAGLGVGGYVLVSRLMTETEGEKGTNPLASANESNKNISASSNSSNTVQSQPTAITNGKKYENSVYGFSFEHDPSVTADEQENDGNGDLIIIHNPKNDSGFQIYITLFDEDGSVLTEERLKQDIPDLIISEAKKIAVGGNAQGLEFVSEDNGEKKQEAWFVSGGENKYLYQLTAPLKSKDFLKAVLASWKFE